jgi:sodium/potassium-transporting ATPase subunit alpha
MLVICVGTDILPAISLAYEDAELDIMTRRPRRKEEHMVSLRLITHAYAQMGFIATAAGFFAYYSVMNYYGFTMTGLFGMATF